MKPNPPSLAALRIIHESLCRRNTQRPALRPRLLCHLGAFPALLVSAQPRPYRRRPTVGAAHCMVGGVCRFVFGIQPAESRFLPRMGAAENHRLVCRQRVLHRHELVDLPLGDYQRSCIGCQLGLFCLAIVQHPARPAGIWRKTQPPSGRRRRIGRGRHPLAGGTRRANPLGRPPAYPQLRPLRVGCWNPF